MLALGLVLGFIWGAKATQESYRLEAKRIADLAKRKDERKAAREAQQVSTDVGTDIPTGAGAAAEPLAAKAPENTKKP